MIRPKRRPLSLAELAAAFPEPGGVFVYLRGVRTCRRFPVRLEVLRRTYRIAAVAVVFAEYLGRLVGLSAVGVRFAAAGAIVIVAAASYRSVRGARPMKGAATQGGSSR